jgi:thiol-disulfide isomerase/thioredoxin
MIVTIGDRKIATSRKSKSITMYVLFLIAFAAAVSSNSIKYAYSDNNVNKAPDFDLKTLDGKQVTLESFKGKPVILWFMATWCPSCVDQADAIKKVKLEYRDKLDVLVIDMWSTQGIGGPGADGLNAETTKDLQNFLSTHGSPEWKATMDTNRAFIKYGITEVDSTVVLDHNGSILLKHLGPSGYQPIKDALTKVVV